MKLCIYSGTPSGVGPIRPSDALHVEVAGIGAMDVHVSPAAGAAAPR